MPIQVGLSAGELIDRITILELKVDQLAEPARSAVERDLRLAVAARDRSLPRLPRLQELTAALRGVNMALWDLEDRVRTCEREQAFGPEFVTLAREIYKNNDRRAALRRAIDVAAGSDTFDYKSHALPEL
jgi:hypothetical protein